ncbi:MAG: UDP-N-acetylglucosamine pyrophosphorylase [Deltaproteobacteria bacterium]|nr:UDP-N-acetylglucosamine pyrophosphorylase [Deltaproteobacteria bacterium]MBW1919519.1 UDP-N-acetylglucosamine pyrophosphorylase [Deltaproteobacteria bacterium]MBW1933927.1 UDP-N-acetylglucosamine pyrophosphorylase [Deltaproteobacteria bacterium]MBW1976982.1 UDP-N-acetylglucosamine pyrophosphorylase [Deltaproteobacteria bacterium]MBW2043722.1 UDP-N-acetylglucosamine pyrophosphorylase [Deltaproteobacteria bacterium]
MELNPRSRDIIQNLIQKGVDIPNPLTLDIGKEVDVSRISGNGVKIFPGCRIYGEKTLIARDVRIGYEGPVTIENCQIGPGVELKGGFFKESVFLEKSSMGLGAHVREGCLLEEQARGAHCVALKQTILFPFVTIGSLVNFCDCLMAGGRGPRNHSEVGSSYIHFNFTPDGDKATPSLIGDVPRGVMVNQPPIFLGGQGGMVGPLRLGYGNVVAAGTILRNDSVEDNKFIVGKSYKGLVTDYTPYQYTSLSRVVRNNMFYLANLVALEQWYKYVRKLFFTRDATGTMLYEGAMEKLYMAKKERTARLKAMAEKMPASLKNHPARGQAAARKKEFQQKASGVCDMFLSDLIDTAQVKELRENFLSQLEAHMPSSNADYLVVIQTLPDSASMAGTRWLQQVVDELCRRVDSTFPSMRLFKI